MISEEISKKIRPGAKVKVYEGKSPFEGLVIARKHGSEAGATFTVRAIIAGVGVEKVSPIHSPAIVKAAGGDQLPVFSSLTIIMPWPYLPPKIKPTEMVFGNMHIA